MLRFLLMTLALVAQSYANADLKIEDFQAECKAHGDKDWCWVAEHIQSTRDLDCQMGKVDLCIGMGRMALKKDDRPAAQGYYHNACASGSNHSCGIEENIKKMSSYNEKQKPDQAQMTSLRRDADNGQTATFEFKNEADKCEQSFEESLMKEQGLKVGPVHEGQRGWQIESLRSGGIYERSGFKVGDVLTALDGVPFGPPQVLMEFIHGFRQKSKKPVTILRNGQTQAMWLEKHCP